MVTSGTMTNRVDRLQQRGLVERIPDAADRRSIRVQLRPEGRDLVDAALADLLDRERALLRGLSRADQRALSTLLRRLVAPFDQLG